VEKCVTDAPIVCTVLLAEDHSDTRTLITTLLELGGYTVDAVEDGEEALALLKVHSYDILLTDLMMPELDGRGLIQAVRKNDRNHSIPIILMTASSEELSPVKEAVQGVIRKPFIAATIFDLLRRLHACPPPVIPIVAVH
jgi:CheY-like chemotaxis protein